MMVTFIIPISIITFLYVGIVKSLRKSQQHTRNTFCREDQYRRLKEDKKITTIIFYLLTSFTIFVSPNRIFWVLSDHGVFKGLSQDIKIYMPMVGDIPYAFHACINPIIYSLVDKKFRQDLKYIFLGGLCRQKAAVNGKKAQKESVNHA